MYAIMETGGKQYRVSEGDVVFIEKLEVGENAAIVFDKVLAVFADNGMTIGSPYVQGAVVNATALKNGKGKKINIITYKAKKGSARRLGHRQPYTKVRIESIKA